MSVGYANSKDSLSKLSPISQPGSNSGMNSGVTYWTRPSEWLTLPSVSPTDEKIVGLVSVANNDSQFIALNCQTTSVNYTVDWGDGNVENFASNTQANHKYDYASISSTLTAEGWKQVIVQVYPTTAGQTLTVIDLNRKYTGTSIVGTLNQYTAGWLDLIISSPTVTNLAVGNSGTNQSYCTRLQQFQLLSTGVTMTNFTLSGCTNLQSIPVLNFSNITTGFNMQSMFQGCVKLQAAPTIDWSKCTNAFQMFLNCYSLVYVPDATTPMSTGWTGAGSVTRLMFQNCYSLVRAPWLDTSKSYSFATMFSGCSSLEYVPNYDYTTCTDLTNMFNGCSSLQMTPTFTNLSSANLIAGTAIFSGCSSLKRAPELPLANIPSVNGMFNGCNSMISLGTYDTSNCTNFTNFFAGCWSLNSLPLVNTTKATVFTTFASTYSVESIPAYSLANCTTIGTIVGGGGNNLASFNATGMKVSFSVIGQKMSKSSLESMFDNCGSNTTTQTITITNNWGADTALSRTSVGITANSNVVTMLTTGVTAGMYLYGTGIQSGIPVTFTDLTDRVTYTNATTNQPMQNDARVMFTAITSTTGISVNTPYYVVNSLVTGFQLSATQGGSPIALTTNGTGTMTIGNTTGNPLPCIITTVNAGNVIISGVAGLTNAAATLTVRSLNTTVASIKNFTITG